ncbi:MAG: hypothetical protein ACLQDL_18190 [Spirochaetia bacterium]
MGRRKTFLPISLVALLMLLLGAGAAYANTYDEIPFVPMSPEVLGRGGSAIADARGYDSLFNNPAGFSRDPSSMTLSSTSVWMYSNPGQLAGLAGQLLHGTSTPASISSFLDNQVTSGGVGAGGAWGIGYVGGGLGLGASFILDSVLSGPSYLASTGDLTGTLGLIAGLSVPFDVGGFRLHVGGDVRPMVRVHALLTNTVAVGILNALSDGGSVLSQLGAAPALYGVGIGVDLGAIAELGAFNVGLSIRDLGGTQFRYNTTPFSVLTSSLASSLQFPSSGSVVSDQYVIPMDIGMGVSFHPDFGTFNNTIDPTFSLEMRNIVGGLSGTDSVWTLLHLGIETKFFSSFTFRTGLNQGSLTLGGGLKFLVFDLNFAVFTRELGTYVGEQPLSGMTFDAAIRW